MINDVFINNAFTFAYGEYLESKENPDGVKYNSFFSVILRLLILIYGEENIINPYKLNNEEFFDKTLMKYGATKDDILDLKVAFSNYYIEENTSDFIIIQKILINLFALKNKKEKINDDDLYTFKSTLYSLKASSPLMVSYNYLMSYDQGYIYEYILRKLNEKEKVLDNRKYLTDEAYLYAGYNLDEVKLFDANTLETINQKVYNFYGIKDSDENKDYLLEKKTYEMLHPRKVLTGNGYLDILYILSIISTLGLLLLLMSIFIL